MYILECYRYYPLGYFLEANVTTPAEVVSTWQTAVVNFESGSNKQIYALLNVQADNVAILCAAGGVLQG